MSDKRAHYAKFAADMGGVVIPFVLNEYAALGPAAIAFLNQAIDLAEKYGSVRDTTVPLHVLKRNFLRDLCMASYAMTAQRSAMFAHQQANVVRRRLESDFAFGTAVAAFTSAAGKSTSSASLLGLKAPRLMEQTDDDSAMRDDNDAPSASGPRMHRC